MAAGLASRWPAISGGGRRPFLNILTFWVEIQARDQGLVFVMNRGSNWWLEYDTIIILLYLLNEGPKKSKGAGRTRPRLASPLSVKSCGDRSRRPLFPRSFRIQYDSVLLQSTDQ
jgi:hypothetical protein